ncbi:MAG: 3-dehydroquinate synthase [Spirochaetia bacterium]|nr:3-dehydroquinate synthase [Spirochaetia bacterium]
METIRVTVKNSPYDICVGSGILKNAGKLMKPVVRGKKVMIVSNRTVYSLYGAALKKTLSKYFTVSVHLMPDGEKYKTLASVEGILNDCAFYGLDRRSAIAALGGGVVGDTAGFAAAIYMRGIQAVQVPTSLLAMFDSSIGGKTGVDMKAGKNLAGAFHQPAIVIADTDTLDTLPEREYINGMAEVIKHGFIMDPKLFKFIKNRKSEILKREKSAVLYIVGRSAADKAKIVSSDEREMSGIREILNYGHTIGHAIEAEGGYKLLKHGEAVALGMAAAVRIAKKTGLCSQKTLNEQINMLNSFNLIKPLKNLKISNILKRMLNDKKTMDGKIRFVLTSEIGHAKLVSSVPISIIKNEVKNLFEHES